MLNIESFMVRYTSPFFYTLEFLVALSVFLIVIYLYIKDIDKKSFLVFLLAGGVNTCVELFLYGFGIRVIEDAFFFGNSIDFPFICIIIGFYEGGVKNLIAFHFVRVAINSEQFSKKVLLLLCAIVFCSFFSYASLIATGLVPSTLTLTARNMFAPLAMILLGIAFAYSAAFFLFKKGLPRKHRISLLYYELGLVIYLLVWMIPLHAFSLRYIGVYEMGSYVPAGFFEQLLLMYGYFLFFEGVGVSIIIYPLIYQLNLIELNKKKY